MGSKIRIMVPQLMAENGINIKGLAEAMGINRGTAGQIAKGNWGIIRPHHLARLCDLFACGVEDILHLQSNGKERE